MGLFSSSEILAAAEDIGNLGTAQGIRFAPHKQLVRTESKNAIRNAVGKLIMGDSLFFVTDGAWNNIQLLEYLLGFTGPASVFFTTWSISAEALTQFNSWTAAGDLTSLHAILAQGIRTRKPALYHPAAAVVGRLRIMKCHHQ